LATERHVLVARNADRAIPATHWLNSLTFCPRGGQQICPGHILKKCLRIAIRRLDRQLVGGANKCARSIDHHTIVHSIRTSALPRRAELTQDHNLVAQAEGLWLDMK